MDDCNNQLPVLDSSTCFTFLESEDRSTTYEVALPSLDELFQIEPKPIMGRQLQVPPRPMRWSQASLQRSHLHEDTWPEKFKELDLHKESQRLLWNSKDESEQQRRDQSFALLRDLLRMCVSCTEECYILTSALDIVYNSSTASTSTTWHR
jgi:hypothetical protein